jgi:hypothetical protein
MVLVIHKKIEPSKSGLKKIQTAGCNDTSELIFFSLGIGIE